VLEVLVNLARLGGMQIVIALTAIVRGKILAVRLGPEGYGEFIQLSLIVLSASVIAAFGLGMSLNRNVAAAAGHDERQRLLSQANAVNLTIALTLAALFAAMILLRPTAISVVGLHVRPDVLWSLALLLAFIPLDAAVQHRVGFLTGALDIKGMASGRSLALVLGTALSAPLVWFFGLIGAALQFTLLTAMIVLMLDRRCRALGFRPWGLRFDRWAFAILARFGIASVIAAFATQFSDLAIRSVLVRLQGASENGVYQAALSITHQVRAVVLGSVGSYMIATLSKTTDRDAIVASANRLLIVVVPIAVVAFSVLGLLSGPAIIVLYSSEFLAAQHVMPILLTSYLGHVLIWVIGAPLLALNRVGVWLAFEITFSVTRFMVALPLVEALGMTAVAIAYAGATAVHLVLNWIYFSRVLGLSIDAKALWLFFSGVAVTASVAMLGSARVFDPAFVVLGFLVVTVYATSSLQAVAGIGPTWRRVRGLLRREGTG
jgi:O-antigen/teichoic acid export membrane protein